MTVTHEQQEALSKLDNAIMATKARAHFARSRGIGNTDLANTMQQVDMLLNVATRLIDDYYQRANGTPVRPQEDSDLNTENADG